jgi:hypothetical protein
MRRSLARSPFPALFDTSSSFGPELQILCLCARSELTTDALARLQALVAQPIDWAELCDAASLHGVSGMLYHHLARHVPDRVPPDVLRTLQGRAQATQLYNLRVMTELVRLAGLFKDEGIPLLTYKGPLLAHRYYGNLAFRRFGDVDLLVRRSDLESANDLLRTEGYTTLRQLSEEEESSWHHHQLGYEFVSADRDVIVELHWALLNRTLTFRLEHEDVWARAESVPLGATSILALAPDDLLLYLCAHGTKHHWSRLLWASDVAQVLRRHPTWDWDSLMRRARSIGSLRTLFLGVTLAARWLDVDLPAEVRVRIAQDTQIDALVHEIEARWFGTEEGLLRPVGWATFWFAVRTRQRLRDNLALLGHYAELAVTPTPHDTDVFALPASLGALYYLIRPLRLARDGGRFLLRRWNGPTPSSSHAESLSSSSSRTSSR